MTKRFFLGLATLTLFFGVPHSVVADYVRFVPPSDPKGIWYDNGPGHIGEVSRGVVFQMSADTTIDSVGIGRGWGGSFQISEVASLGPNLQTGAKILRSSLGLIPTVQPPWLNFSITPLLLQKGHDYYVEFTSTPGTQSFFYDDSNGPFNVGNFTSVHGTFADSTNNTFVPEIQVHVQDVAAAPEPSSLILLGIGVLGMVGFRLRN